MGDATKAKNIEAGIFEYAEALDFGELHIKTDRATGMRAIIALHNLKLGPALGGCRFIRYGSTEEAMQDAMRLARGMSYKSAISGIPHGGGKAVIMYPDKVENREALFHAFGKFIHDLGGRYITAVDSGTTLHDMDIIATETPYVSCRNVVEGKQVDPSPYTARGVCFGIEAAVHHKLGRDSLEGLHVAIQGVGNVGYPLAQMLHERGARLTVCDTNERRLENAQADFGATVVGLDEIYDVACDVFAPCALGASLNETTIPRLNTTIVAGSANNQLAHEEDGTRLCERGILYAPDYVINAGGLIRCATYYADTSDKETSKRIENLYPTLLEIYRRAEESGKPTSVVADAMAEEKLRG